MKAYLVELGYILPPGDKEFKAYNIVYDHKYGYYDTEQYYTADLENAKKYVKEHATKGSTNYGVISTTFVDTDNEKELENMQIQNESYAPNCVVYSVLNINNRLNENFIKAA